MAEGVLLLRENSSQEENSGVIAQRRRHRLLLRRPTWRQRRLKGSSAVAEPLDVIDLTGDDLGVRTSACHDLEIIDLTESDGTMDSSLQNSSYFAWGQKHTTPINSVTRCSLNNLTAVDDESKDDVSVSMWIQDCEQPPKSDVGKLDSFQSNNFSHPSTYSEESEGSSHTIYNSDLGSLGSPQQESGVFCFSSGNDGNECATFSDCVEEAPHICLCKGNPNSQLCPLHQRLFPNLTLYCSPSVAQADQPLFQAKKPWHAMESNVQEQSTQIDMKVWLKTLQYCQGVPVYHPFLQNVVLENNSRKYNRLKPKPIPSWTLSMVSSTIEESFFQGTLDFLMDYVSCQHYPPKEVTSYVVRHILLSQESQDVQQEIQNGAYMLLMKIQALHPATVDTVVWDWQLLHEIMEMQEENVPGRLLFLQYVVQTLEDDFQKTIRTNVMHRSIAKSVLSCDKCFSNVKEVIKWLTAVVTGATISHQRKNLLEAKNQLLDTPTGQYCISSPELPLNKEPQKDDVSVQFQNQKEAALLQRMLSIAVEVDKSPNCSANKIADMVFSYVLNIPKHCQRDAFLRTMECHLLRCKVLEFIFEHSCSIPTKQPLSMAKILYFLNHFSLLLTYQDNEATWQRWDEMLHQLNLLLLSYRAVVLGHLRSSVSERISLIIKAAKPKLQSHDYIEETDVQCSIQNFQKKLCQLLGQPIPSSISETIQLLQKKIPSWTGSLAHQLQWSLFS